MRLYLDIFKILCLLVFSPFETNLHNVCELRLLTAQDCSAGLFGKGGIVYLFIFRSLVFVYFLPTLDLCELQLKLSLERL